MNNFLKKRREILAIFAYVALIAGLFYAVIFPLISKINDVNDRLQEETLKQESARQHLSELPKIQQQYEVIEKNATSLDVLLDKNNAVGLIETLEKLADETGNSITISVQDQSPAKSSAKAKNAQENTIVNSLPSQNYLQLKITLNGDFDRMGKFIKALESFEYYCDIIGIQIKDTKEEDKLSGGDPFDSKSKQSAAAESKKSGDLEAVLDVVFYAK